MPAYDYVIVGAGSAGCVLAARLSEDPAVRVLLLEAGGPDRRREFRVPLAYSRLFRTEYDWNYTTAKQAAMNDREMYWPRGRTLGGSSSLNGQMWVRGHRRDYDDWGIPGWSYDEVLPCFRRAERRRGTNTGDVYGTAGPLWIQELRDPNPATAAFLEACAEVGMDRLGELNDPDNEGYGPAPVTQRRGRRWSVADGYLRPAMRRPNLTVVTGGLARRVVIEDGRATGVEYSGPGGTRTVEHAAREVILSAGAIGSPQLLMASGVGDPDDLRAAGIEPVRELPAVGANLQDHLVVCLFAHCSRPITLFRAESPWQRARYALFRRGPLSSNVGEAAAFLRSSNAELAPDLEIVFVPAAFIDHGLTPSPGHGLTLGVVLLRPESRGRIRPAGPDPAEPPVIDPAYLTAEGDLARLVTGLKAARRLLATEAMSGLCGEPMAPWHGGESDEELAGNVREHGQTLYHPAGTCRMGVDAGSVVDPSLRVRGIAGLRVADVSIMPALNRGHTHAPAVMIGEKASDLIRSGS
ncbi:GMC family oxidoreductase [Bailinhaonella thermotolerans]|uniref:Choline dehydrogenase n=1 Tax=Bailinhaonella thermotolerans TaxID=1070861 RepID=A0A3A4BI19_9ACTN|nr:GMC family oxidoreductase N-terminal domain-containing protein [Bailinhaonella thermotolerans]RJL34452.1 choline dehydrogenase [Bailinhaonella thermotolerans]